MRKSELIAMLKSIEGDYEVMVAGEDGTRAHIVDKHVSGDGSVLLLISGPNDEAVEIRVASDYNDE